MPKAYASSTINYRYGHTIYWAFRPSLGLYWSAMPVKRLSKTRSRTLWSILIAQNLPNNIPSLTIFAVHRASIGCLRCIHKLSRNILFIFDFILLLVSFSHVPLSPCEAEIANLSPLVLPVNCIQLSLNLGEKWDQTLTLYRFLDFR